jgi:hypothetical protein
MPSLYPHYIPSTSSLLTLTSPAYPRKWLLKPPLSPFQINISTYKSDMFGFMPLYTHYWGQNGILPKHITISGSCLHFHFDDGSSLLRVTVDWLRTDFAPLRCAGGSTGLPGLPGSWGNWRKWLPGVQLGCKLWV